MIWIQRHDSRAANGSDCNIYITSSLAGNSKALILQTKFIITLIEIFYQPNMNKYSFNQLDNCKQPSQTRSTISHTLTPKLRLVLVFFNLLLTLWAHNNQLAGLLGHIKIYQSKLLHMIRCTWCMSTTKWIIPHYINSFDIPVRQ